jgi:hypothetical protein
MIKIRKYSVPEAMKRLHDGETLYNSKLGIEIEYNGEPGNRKTDFNYAINVSRDGEFERGYNEGFIDEYMRYSGLPANPSVYTLKNLTEFKKDFDCIHSRIEPVYRPMTRFEMLGWANSDESKGWLARVIDKKNKACSKWLLPQQLQYDPINNNTSYERIKLLPDHSDIDESTKNDFKVRDTDYQFYTMADKKPGQQQENDYGR